jgi:hypothetical protein
MISTARGLQVSLLLVSRGETKGEAQADVDSVMRYFTVWGTTDEGVSAGWTMKSGTRMIE